MKESLSLRFYLSFDLILIRKWKLLLKEFTSILALRCKVSSFSHIFSEKGRLLIPLIALQKLLLKSFLWTWPDDLNVLLVDLIWCEICLISLIVIWVNFLLGKYTEGIISAKFIWRLFKSIVQLLLNFPVFS